MTLFNKIIRHERNMDVCYLITKCFDVGHKHKMKAHVINMGYKNSWFVNEQVKVEIPREDLSKWHVCNIDANMVFYGIDKTCLRYKEWSRIKV